MNELIQHQFTFWDWAVIVGYLLLTTVVGHCMRGKQGTIRDFFLGGRSLPWQAVSGSIIATEISGVTFIGVAGSLFALHGNFTYLLWGIGSIIGRVIVAKWFVPIFYEEEIYSPYDYMGRRLGVGAKKLATVVFTVGSILAQSVRVFVAAIPLKVVTGLPIEVCIVAIGLFAIGWTLMGGMRTVIWTDVMQFGLFTFGGLLTLFWIVNSLDGGWGEYWQTSVLYARTDGWDARFGFGAELKFTLWVAIFAVPFQNLTAFGVDQLNAQRMFCCKDAKSAQKALLWSSTGQLMTLMMLLVGSALVVHYDKNPFTPHEGIVVMGVTEQDEQKALKQAEVALAGAPRLENPKVQQKRDVYLAKHGAEAVGFDDPMISNVAKVNKPDNVFPMWIVTELPVGLSGLILAGVFAAAISSLDSILAALSQTTLSLLYHPENKTDEELEKLNLVSKSRMLVIAWGVVLTLLTLLLMKANEGVNVLSLAFGMTAYTMGPMLGLFFAAMSGKASIKGLTIGVVISLVCVLFVRTDVWNLLVTQREWLAVMLDQFPTLEMQTYEVAGVVKYKMKALYFFGWAWPLTALLTFVCGLLIGQRKSVSK